MEQRKPVLMIVEDEWLIAEYLRDVLETEGYEVHPHAASVSEALLRIEQDQIDAAIIDFRLLRETSEQVATALAKKSIPFAFMTGLGAQDLPEEFRARPTLTKPIEATRLLQVLSELTKPK